MFDMQHVSVTIASLRKARNMTQMELADRLNISFQAVSNWERGQTLPDIGKLGELADIFGVTIDELLGKGPAAEVVSKLIHDEPMEKPLSAEAFLDVAPLVKPNQAEKLWESVQEVSMKELVMAAPFLSESTLDALAVQSMRREKSFQGLTGLLPFLSKDALEQCLAVALEEGLDMKKIMAAVPFLGKKAVAKLADAALQRGGVSDLVMLAPFLKKDKLNETAAACVEKYGFSKILPLLPFLDQDLLDGFFQNKYKPS